MSDIGDDILQALSILSGSALKAQNASLLADTSIAKSNAAIEIQELENEQYHHKAGLNQSSDRLNKILDRQETELKELNRWLAERDVAYSEFMNIDDMNKSLEGNALWEERGQEIQDDLMVWGEVTGNAMTGIAQMKDARAINSERIDQLNAMKQEYLLGAQEASLVGEELHHEGLQDRLDFEEYVKNHKEMDGVVDTIFEYGFESKKPTVETQLSRDKSISSLVLDGLRTEQIKQGMVKGELDIQYLENQIDSLEDEEMWKAANRYKGLMISLYNVADYDGATQMRDELYKTLGMELPTSDIHDEDMEGDASSTALGPKPTADKNAPDFEGAFDQETVDLVNSRMKNLREEFTAITLHEDLEKSDYYQSRPYALDKLNVGLSTIQTPQDLVSAHEKIIDNIIYDLSFASDGNLDYWTGLAGGVVINNKNKIWKTHEDFTGYAEKRAFIDTVLPFLVSGEKGGGKGSKYSNMGLIADENSAEYLDFYTENNPFNPDDYSHTADAEGAMEAGYALGYGQEHQLLVGQLEFYKQLNDIRVELEPQYEGLKYEDMLKIKDEAMSSGSDKKRFTIVNTTQLQDDELKSSLNNAATLEDFLTVAGHESDVDTMARAWNVYLQNADTEKLMDKGFGLEWTGSDAQKEYLLGVLKADVALSNMNQDQSSRLEESLNLLTQNHVFEEEETDMEYTQEQIDTAALYGVDLNADPTYSRGMTGGSHVPSEEVLASLNTLSPSNETINPNNQMANLGPQADENTDTLNAQNMVPSEDGSFSQEFLTDLDKAFSKEDVVHSEVQNLTQTSKDLGLKVNNEDLAKLEKLQLHFPITDSEMTDSLKLMDAGLGADTTRQMLMTYHTLGEDYKKNVPFRRYLQIYAGSKYGASLNEIDLDNLFTQ